ncbi:helix-turn-helix domain-containing protein [Dehalobacter restrictus]|uniref:Transposase n=1 Tax=Dehalobacter restrictus (strain DSM 9455 / PER-K23) TaxID=871738 RepID=A0ABM5P6T9_DEHRP|nr:transposase [Dehalobacter restrictus DSM 9455]
MPSVKYIIELTESDRKALTDLVTKGIAPAKLILRANILLASDRNSTKHMTVAEIAETFHTTPTTVQTVKTTYVEKGLEQTLVRRKRKIPPVPAKVTGDVEAHIIALCCSNPPKGYSRWTVRLLSEKCIELGYVKSISPMTISRTLKKTNLSLT